MIEDQKIGTETEVDIEEGREWERNGEVREREMEGDPDKTT